MRIVYVLESKIVDSKGRQKNPKHLGVFSNLDVLEKAKEDFLKNNHNAVFFIHTSTSWI